jgi:hypothetical protein
MIGTTIGTKMGNDYDRDNDQDKEGLPNISLSSDAIRRASGKRSNASENHKWEKVKKIKQALIIIYGPYVAAVAKDFQAVWPMLCQFCSLPSW